MSGDPLLRVEAIAEAFRAAAAGKMPRWLVLSRFGLDFLASHLTPTPPVEAAGLGLVRAGTLQGFPFLALDRDDADDRTDAVAPALVDALPLFAARRAGLRGVVQCVAAATLAADGTVPDFALVGDWLRWHDDDPMRGLPAARLGARYPDLRGARHAPELAALATLPAASPLRPAIAVARRGPTGASVAELEAMRRLGGEVVVDGGAAEAITALQQGLAQVTVALVLDRALAWPPADPGALAVAAATLLPRLPPLLGAILAHVPLDAEATA